MSRTFIGKVVVTQYVGEAEQTCCGVRTRYQVSQSNGAVSYFSHCEWAELQRLTGEDFNE